MLPNHFWMNLLFILNGITFCIGVLYISQHLEKTKINKIATFFILIIGVSTIVSGLIPADINLIGHSILVWIGMLTVFPGLFIFAKNLKKAGKWTYFCLLSLIVITILISLIFSFPLTCRSTTKTFLLGSFCLGSCINLQINKIKFLYKNAHLSGTNVK